MDFDARLSKPPHLKEPTEPTLFFCLFFWPAALCQRRAIEVGGLAQDAGLLQCLGSIRAGRHLAGFFQRRRCFGIHVMSIDRLFDGARHCSLRLSGAALPHKEHEAGECDRHQSQPDDANLEGKIISHEVNETRPGSMGRPVQFVPRTKLGPC